MRLKVTAIADAPMTLVRDDPTHPVQATPPNGREATAPTCVTMRAYEVYCAIYGPQEAMVTGDCRGGFSSGGLIAFLYARSFPRKEWAQRVAEARAGLNV